MKFKNYAHQLKVPFVIYADFESLTVPINSANNNDNKSYTETYQHHTPCGFAYKVVCCEDQYTKPIELYRGQNCVEKFLDCMKQEKKYISKIINQNKNFKKITKQDQENYKNAKVCHICEKKLNDDKVWDHCHITGKYRGAAHDNCNKNMLFLNIFQLYFTI